MSAQKTIAALVIAGTLAASAAAADCPSLRDLIAIQQQYAQLMSGDQFTLVELVKFQQALAEFRAQYGTCSQKPAPRVPEPGTLARLATLQEVYARLAAEIAAGTASVAELAEFQRELAQWAAAYRPQPSMMQIMVEMQIEWARLVEAYKAGKATLADIVAFQQKWSAFYRAIVASAKVAKAPVAGSASTPLQSASWGHIKAAFE
jgi:hypothetical protein